MPDSNASQKWHTKEKGRLLRLEAKRPLRLTPKRLQEALMSNEHIECNDWDMCYVQRTTSAMLGAPHVQCDTYICHSTSTPHDE